MSPRGFSEARRELAAHQKTRRGAPPYSRFVNRPAGRVLAAAASVTKATPDQVTLLSAACSAGGIAIIAVFSPSIVTAIASVALLVLGYALDSADGQLARLRGGGSPAGEWLDHTVDAAKITSLHLAVLLALHRADDLPSIHWLLVPLGFTLTAGVLFFSWILRDVLVAGTEVSTNRRDDGQAPSVVASLGRALEDYGVLMLVLLTLPATRLFLICYSVLFAWSVLMVVVALPRRFRAIAAVAERRDP